MRWVNGGIRNRSRVEYSRLAWNDRNGGLSLGE